MAKRTPRRIPLEFDAAPFSYMAIDSNGNPLVILYAEPPSRYELGKLTELLREVRYALPHLNVRSLLWLPVYMESNTGFRPRILH